MDAFAVAVSSGVTIKNFKLKNALTMALFFGGFQAVMPVIGWLAGMGLKQFIVDWDHWVAFGLLSFIGIKMIYESFKIKEETDGDGAMSLYVLFVLSVATSIDALIVGTTFAFLDMVIFVPVVIIGIVTFCFSLAGAYIGKKVGHFFENKIEIIGGLTLIAIGFKILLEHLK